MVPPDAVAVPMAAAARATPMACSYLAAHVDQAAGESLLGICDTVGGHDCGGEGAGGGAVAGEDQGHYNQ